MWKIKFSIIFLFIFSFLLNSNTVLAFASGAGSDAIEKTVYLTFDDGPSRTSDKILDILKKEEVQGTFFVIGEQVSYYKDSLLRMKNEGHSIGLHSFSHEKHKLYCNEESFIKEMKKTQEIIKEELDLEVNILRFPFGCNNNSYKLTKNMVTKLHGENLLIYDWNQDSGDGANYKLTPYKIYRNSVSKKDTVILLMHCSNLNKTTISALPSVIKYYKDAGYTFKTIDEQTKEQYRILK